MWISSRSGWTEAWRPEGPCTGTANDAENDAMIVTPIRTPRIEADQALLPILLAAQERPLQERDVLCVTSKVVALEQGRCVKLSDVTLTEAARSLPQLAYSKDFKAYP